MKPILSKQLPSFTAAKISANSVSLNIGDDVVLSGKNINVALNLGGPLISGASALIGNATVDFAESFPAEPDQNQPAGYEVQTGTTSEPIVIDFDGGELIRASVGDARLKVFGFVYIEGSIAFEKGNVQTVKVTGGLFSQLTGSASQDLLTSVGIPPEIADQLPLAGGSTTEISFLTVGASNVHAFVGINGPDHTETGEVNSHAVGLSINNFDFGLAMMRPTTRTHSPPSVPRA